MAQTGYTPIQLYYSSTTTNVPLAANLASGELAINITDGKLFYKDNANAVQVIGWKVVPATAGGTGQTSYAVGDLLYADTTTTLAKLADVATGNALISGGVNTAPAWGKIGLTTHVSGVLPVANGGTGLTTLTAGYIPFGAGTSALGSTQYLFWDNTNNRLGVSTNAAPQYKLQVGNGTGQTDAVYVYGAGSGSADTRLILSGIGNGGANRGTTLLFQSPGSTSAIDTVKLLALQETASATANNASFVVQVAATATGTLTERFRIGPAGQYGIGGANYGTSGQVLTSGGASAAPTWSNLNLATSVTGVLPIANGGTNASTASITSFNNITGYTASGATGTTSTNLVFSTSPSITTPTLVGDATLSTGNVVVSTSGKGVTTGSSIPLGLGVNNAVSAATIDTSSNFNIGQTSAISGAKLTVNGQIASSPFFGINTSTATTVATGVSFLAVFRCRGSGGTALVLYDNGGTTPIVIVSQTGPVTFVTTAPVGNQIQLANGGNSITALAGSTVGANNLNVTVIQNQ